jgi:hypothetical protein
MALEAVAMLRRERLAANPFAPRAIRCTAIIHAYVESVDATDIHPWLAVAHDLNGSADEACR